MDSGPPGLIKHEILQIRYIFRSSATLFIKRNAFPVICIMNPNPSDSARDQPSILLHPNHGGRQLFGYSDADLTTGMIHMSRMGLTSGAIDRLQIICNQNKRLSTSTGSRHHSGGGDGGQRGGGGGLSAYGGTTGGGEDRHGLTGGPASGARQGVQTAPGGAGNSSSGLAKHSRNAFGGLTTTDDGEGGQGTEEAGVEPQDSGIGDNDHSQTLKLKAAQALFRMSLEPGGEVRWTRASAGCNIFGGKVADVEYSRASMALRCTIAPSAGSFQRPNPTPNTTTLVAICFGRRDETPSI